MRIAEFKHRLTRFLRRHRRPFAAILAAIAVVLAMSALRPAPAVPAVTEQTSTDLLPGEVAIPVGLASPALSATLAVGDVIDLVGVPNAELEGDATIVAARTRVLEIPGSSGSFGSTASAVILVAVKEADALDVSQAAARGPVGVVIRTRSQPR